MKDPRLLVPTSRDDAAVYRVSDDSALVLSVDYFTPIVDDPYQYGAIAAANSFSDIYAMGAKPLLALNLVGFPSRELPLEILENIMKGGSDKAAEAGALVVGGHSIDDVEVKYGMCVVAIVHPDHVVANSGARPGDLIFLTKPLGTGIVTTGLKFEKASPHAIEEATRSMMRLNRDACEAMLQAHAEACTDVTGFGLLGHLFEVCQASGVAGRIRSRDVPLLPDTVELALEGCLSGGLERNLDYFGPHVSWAEGIEQTQRQILADPQTSGGLLIFIAKERAEALISGLEERHVMAACLGEVMEGPPGIQVV
jgi:selenide,water dikinase